MALAITLIWIMILGLRVQRHVDLHYGAEIEGLRSTESEVW